MLIKPLVVSVVKQRPILTYGHAQISEIVDQLETAAPISAAA
jgi:hypothetical protein